MFIFGRVYDVCNFYFFIIFKNCMWCGMHGTVTFKKFVTEFIVLENKENNNSSIFLYKNLNSFKVLK